MIEPTTDDLARLFSVVHDSQETRARPGKRGVVIHHSRRIAGVRLSANDFTKRFTLFSSKDNMMRWRFEFETNLRTVPLQAEQLPVSNVPTIFLKGPLIPESDEFRWLAFSVAKAYFTEFETNSFKEDWIKLVLFEKEWRV
jgi:hypothetical protein